MASLTWPTRRFTVASLQLDPKNPRLGRETLARAPREILQYLFDHDKALEVAESIANRGYFPNEPLLGIRENGRLVIVEGNRRLAALKALRQPGLLAGSNQRKVERIARQVIDIESIATVPVTIAPNRRATDRLLAGRHIGTPVLAWQAENRASFILDKLEEGYDNEELEEELGFSLADIQNARQTRAIADMARSIYLPDEIKAKLENPRAKVFTTLERVFDSSVGREFLKIERDPEHGIRGTTTSAEFVRGFAKLVTDVALGKQSSRTLNNNADIRRYFEGWTVGEIPAAKRGTFVPADAVRGRTVASQTRAQEHILRPKRAKQETKTVLPKDLKVRFGSERLADIRGELTRLSRIKFPNAGAVLLRVFFELSALEYLKRTGELDKVRAELGAKGKLPPGDLTMRHLVPALTRIAKEKLASSDSERVEKALRHDRSAPFSLNDLHAFVHQPSDPPSERDIWQFWIRTEPLFRLMLERNDPQVSQ